MLLTYYLYIWLDIYFKNKCYCYVSLHVLIAIGGLVLRRTWAPTVDTRAAPGRVTGQEDATTLSAASRAGSGGGARSTRLARNRPSHLHPARKESRKRRKVSYRKRRGSPRVATGHRQQDTRLEKDRT